MDELSKKETQSGIANPRMKKIWMIRWSYLFVFFFIFFMIFIGISFIEFLTESGLPMLIFFYVILPVLIGVILSYIWAHLYWTNYSFDLSGEKITVTRGVIGKRITNIPYERIQNVNIWRGILERIFNLYDIQIETAGAFSGGSYGRSSFSEGTIQGLVNPDPVVKYIMAKAKGNDGLGDTTKSGQGLEKEEKLELLEERLIKGEISEKTYQELKEKYEKE